MAAVSLEQFGEPLQPQIPEAPPLPASLKRRGHLDTKIAHFDRHVAKSVQWMQIAIHIIDFIGIAFVIANAVLPFVGGTPPAVFWSGFAFIIVGEVYASGKLTHAIKMKERAKRETHLTKEMLSWKEGAKPFSVQGLPADKRLKALKKQDKDQLTPQEQAKKFFSISTGMREIMSAGAKFSDLVNHLDLAVHPEVEAAYLSAEAEGAPLIDRGKKWNQLQGDVAICSQDLVQAYDTKNQLFYQRYQGGMDRVRQAAYHLPTPFSVQFGQVLKLNPEANNSFPVKSSTELLFAHEHERSFYLNGVQRECLALYHDLFFDEQGKRRKRGEDFRKNWFPPQEKMKTLTVNRMRTLLDPDKCAELQAFNIHQNLRQEITDTEQQKILDERINADFVRLTKFLEIIDLRSCLLEVERTCKNPEKLRIIREELELLQPEWIKIEKMMKSPSFAEIATLVAQEERLIRHYEELMDFHHNNLLKANLFYLVKIGKTLCGRLPQPNQETVLNLFKKLERDLINTKSRNFDQERFNLYKILTGNFPMVQIWDPVQKKMIDDPNIVQYVGCIERYTALLLQPNKDSLDDKAYQEMSGVLEKLFADIKPFYHEMCGLTRDGKVKHDTPKMSRWENCADKCSLIGKVLCSSSPPEPFKSLNHLHTKELALKHRVKMQEADSKYMRFHYIHHLALRIIGVILAFIFYFYSHHEWVAFGINAGFFALVPMHRFTRGKLEKIGEEIDLLRMKEKVFPRSLDAEEGPQMKKWLQRMEAGLPVPESFIQREVPRWPKENESDRDKVRDYFDKEKATETIKEFDLQRKRRPLKDDAIGPVRSKEEYGKEIDLLERAVLSADDISRAKKLLQEPILETLSKREVPRGHESGDFDSEKANALIAEMDRQIKARALDDSLLFPKNK